MADGLLQLMKKTRTTDDGDTVIPAKGGTMRVRYNDDEEMVRSIKEGLEMTGGYCPCKIHQSEDTKCMCIEFREQIKDPDFEGYCHCMLYYKEK